jgi:hypothetical protein
VSNQTPALIDPETLSMPAFTSTLFQEGKTATGIQVPAEIVDALCHGKRPPVKVTINSHTYRSTIAPMGGLFWIPVSAAVRAQAGIAAGDHLNVEVMLDDEPRTVDVPHDLAAALASDAAVNARFAALSYSNQRRITLQIESAKTAETRNRRITKAVDDLRSAAITSDQPT